MRIRTTALAAAAALGLLAVGSTTAAASADTPGNPSSACTAVGNGGIDHGGCTSTAARFGSADLENLPYLSTSAFVSNCTSLPSLFQQITGSVPPQAYPVQVGTRTFSDATSLADYIFHDIFGPDMSTCIAILGADHATIANPGPQGPYDVYYTGGHGKNTTYLPGIPDELIPLFGG